MDVLPTQAAAQQQFIPLLSPVKARQQSAPAIAPCTTAASSIWTPQPQPPRMAWPDTTGSAFIAPRNKEQNDFLDFAKKTSILDRIGKESLFQDFRTPALPSAVEKSVGTIGDGRRDAFADTEFEHAEQILRSLNLNSPSSRGRPSRLNLDTDVPDISPRSSSSFPMTPFEPSPVTPCSTFEMNYSNPSPPLDRSQFPIMDPAPYMRHSLTDSAFEHGLPRSMSQGLQGQMKDSFESLWRGRAPSGTGDMLSQDILSDAKFRREFGTDMDNFNGLHSPTFSNPFSPTSPTAPFQRQSQPPQSQGQDSINFLSLLHPSSSPPYVLFVNRVVKSSDQQASIFLQQKLKVVDEYERAKIVDAICTKGYEMMAHRFGNWAVQRCLEAASSPAERRKIARCMRGRVVDLATNCYGCHVLQKALDCEEDIRLLIVSELLLGDPAETLINKHASHVWSKIMELTWTPPVPPIFDFVTKALEGKWASLACHETGSLVVQHAFENLEHTAKSRIIAELLDRGYLIFAEVAKNQWGSYCIQHILEHGSPQHRELVVAHLVTGLSELAVHEQGFKSITKALKEGGKDVLSRFARKMCDPQQGGRRPAIVDLALSPTGSQLIASMLPVIEKEQRTMLYDAIRGHIVTLRGCKTGSKVIWLFDRMVRDRTDANALPSMCSFDTQRTYYGP